MFVRAQIPYYIRFDRGDSVIDAVSPGILLCGGHGKCARVHGDRIEIGNSRRQRNRDDAAPAAKIENLEASLQRHPSQTRLCQFDEDLRIRPRDEYARRHDERPRHELRRTEDVL